MNAVSDVTLVLNNVFKCTKYSAVLLTRECCHVVARAQSPSLIDLDFSWLELFPQVFLIIVDINLE